MTKLSININKIATIRNARGGNNPNLVQVAKDCERFGAQGITIHPRPDQRHITRKDVYDLKDIVNTEFNIEGYPSKDFLRMIAEVRPEQVTLVPDPPEAITSNAGWDTITHFSFLADVVSELKSYGCRVSLFTDTNLDAIEKCVEIGTDRIELYTEAYATGFERDKEAAILPYQIAAKKAQELGLGLNAGHDLSLENLAYFHKNIPNLLEVSIGHALVCDALYFGLENTVQMYLRQLS